MAMHGANDSNITRHRTFTPGRELPASNDLATVLNRLNGMHSGDAAMLDVVHYPSGIVLRPKVATPFAGKINPSNTAQVTIGASRAESGYPYRDTITIGIDALQKTAAETVTISATSFVYYTITKSGTAITATLTANATYPTQTTSTFYVVLGRAVWDTDHVSRWHQYWYGDILVPAVIIDAEDCS